MQLLSVLYQPFTLHIVKYLFSTVAAAPQYHTLHSSVLLVLYLNNTVHHNIIFITVPFHPLWYHISMLNHTLTFTLRKRNILGIVVLYCTFISGAHLKPLDRNDKNKVRPSIWNSLASSATKKASKLAPQDTENSVYPTDFQYVSIDWIVAEQAIFLLGLVVLFFMYLILFVVLEILGPTAYLSWYLGETGYSPEVCCPGVRYNSDI